MTSAIFNQAGDSVIAATYSSDQPLVLMNPANLAITKNLKLSFEECSHNVFKIYYLSGYYKNNLMAYGVVFIDENAIENNFGHLMYFWIGADLN